MLAKKQPSDVLRKLGKWIRSTKFTNRVAEELGISVGHAWKLIKKDKTILKEKLPSGHVLCGLPEFGPLKLENKKLVEHKAPKRLLKAKYSTTPLWKKQANEDFLKIRNAVANDDASIVQVPYTAIRVLDSYPKLKENMTPEYNILTRKFNQAYKNLPIDFIPRETELRARLREIAHKVVPSIYEKAFRLLHEG